VIATFITAFGAGGVVGTAGLRWSAGPSLGLALGSGLAIGYLVLAVLRAVYTRTQGSSEAHAGAIIGLTAEVLAPITEDGMGEVAYVCRGTRYTGSARSANGTRIEKRSLVKIVKVVGSTLFVETIAVNQKSGDA
jgi:membrane-bound ClpP family serine protease